MKLTAHEVNIPGPEGNIQAVLDLPVENMNQQYFSVNCHPHSLHGGTMTNKVVHTLSRSLAGFGVPGIRFNFRGVGQSDGSFNEGRGEVDDLISVVDWMKQRYPNAKMLLTGFSFGSYVSISAASQLMPELLISVAPPVKRFDFQQIQIPGCQWHIIMGDNDELVDYESVCEWVAEIERDIELAASPELITMSGASHFFHGRLIELREQVERLVLPLLRTTI